MFESCEHPVCGYDGRVEYCEIEAVDPDGAVLVVTELLDELLYAHGVSKSDDYRLSTDGKVQMLNRSVSFLQSDSRDRSAPLTETQIHICHQINKRIGSEHYGVDVSWRVARKDANEGRFRTQYFIDIYPQGKVQAFTEKPDLIHGGFEEQRMTPYDYERLFDDLSYVYNLQLAETADNGTVL